MHGKNLFYFFGGPGHQQEQTAIATGSALAAAAAPVAPPDTPAAAVVPASLPPPAAAAAATATVIEAAALLDAAPPVVVHIHFGMSGAFRTMSLPGPEPTETTRLELVNRSVQAFCGRACQIHGTVAAFACTLHPPAVKGVDPVSFGIPHCRLQHTTRTTALCFTCRPDAPLRGLSAGLDDVVLTCAKCPHAPMATGSWAWWRTLAL